MRHTFVFGALLCLFFHSSDSLSGTVHHRSPVSSGSSAELPRWQRWLQGSTFGCSVLQPWKRRPRRTVGMQGRDEEIAEIRFDSSYMRRVRLSSRRIHTGGILRAGVLSGENRFFQWIIAERKWAAQAQWIHALDQRIFVRPERDLSRSCGARILRFLPLLLVPVYCGHPPLQPRAFSVRRWLPTTRNPIRGLPQFTAPCSRPVRHPSALLGTPVSEHELRDTGERTVHAAPVERAFEPTSFFGIDCTSGDYTATDVGNVLSDVITSAGFGGTDRR
ncbi:uncharacterized protein LOC142560350 isoform X6 [Dermacentor variabilis]|uniref:uncharacterized protein LOC142560350 isoform X6 n=1 Tax=Dermacentor variabilis TaxID=34621 RepID=UPI003F5B0CF5